MIAPPEQVRIGEAARIPGVCVETLRTWDQEGKLKPLRTPGRHRVYRTAVLEELLEKRERVVEALQERRAMQRTVERQEGEYQRRLEEMSRCIAI
jgi:DNA-binding transcriptional MerR regulator